MNGATTRRRFFGSAAVLAAPLAAGAASASDDLAARLTALEDADAIRALLREWAQNVNAGNVASPVANLSRVTLESDAAITVAANGTAAVRVSCGVETAKPLDGDETLVEMARQQGDGVVRRSERRMLAGTCVKRGGIWVLEQTELTA